MIDPFSGTIIISIIIIGRYTFAAYLFSSSNPDPKESTLNVSVRASFVIRPNTLLLTIM